MIDEERPARRTVLDTHPEGETTASRWLVGNGRGVMLTVLTLVGIGTVAALVMGAMGLHAIYTGALQERGRRSQVAADLKKGAARVERGKWERSNATPRIDSENPAAKVPLSDPAGWIVPDDYPAPALRGNMEGRVAIAWTVGSDGLVTECITTASSGHGILDRAACDAIARRARYPAVETTAKPRVFERRVVWQIPD